MSRRNRQQQPVYVRPPQEIETRFGKVIETEAPEWRGHYKSVFFEGRPDAVFWIIGRRLEATSTCYEHTFQVRKIEVLEDGPYWNRFQKVKVECEWTSYVGD